MSYRQNKLQLLHQKAGSCAGLLVKMERGFTVKSMKINQRIGELLNSSQNQMDKCRGSKKPKAESNCFSSQNFREPSLSENNPIFSILIYKVWFLPLFSSQICANTWVHRLYP